jgi:hypothetical protein
LFDLRIAENDLLRVCCYTAYYESEEEEFSHESEFGIKIDYDFEFKIQDLQLLAFVIAILLQREKQSLLVSNRLLFQCPVSSDLLCLSASLRLPPFPLMEKVAPKDQGCREAAKTCLPAGRMLCPAEEKQVQAIVHHQAAVGLTS